MQGQAQGAHSGIVPKLSLVLFLQFFMWGAWNLSLGVFMDTQGMGTSATFAYSLPPIAAILAPILAGLIADRYFNTEKVLAALFLLAGACMLMLPGIAGLPEGEAFMGLPRTTAFLTFLFLHTLFFMPTLALTASLAFYQLPNGSLQFPKVRVWGTIGWIIAGVTLAAIVGGNTSVIQFQLAGGASILLGLFCLTLPATPAPKKGEPVDTRALLFMDAWSQMKNRSFFVFIICSFLVCIPLAAYYASGGPLIQSTGVAGQTAWQNIGTVFEAVMMLVMATLLARLGVRKMIALGIAAWVLRYILFGLGAPMVDPNNAVASAGFWLIILGVALHGVCYDFFFVTGQIYVDNATPRDIRGQAQGLNIFFTQGLGLWLGAILMAGMTNRIFGQLPGGVGDRSTAAALPLWPQFWFPLAIFAAVVLAVFLIFFTDAAKLTGEAAEGYEDNIGGPPMETPIEHGFDVTDVEGSPKV